MSIVKDFAIPFSKSKERIELNCTKASKANRITVIIGENGTRKSYLLRRILDAALPNISSISQPQLFTDENQPVCFLSHPKKVIAVSAVPYDRFPSKSNFGETSRVSRYDSDSYSYIGPRTSRNIISQNQSVRELILNTLRNPDDFISRGSFLSMIGTEIGIETNFRFGLNPRFSSYGGNDGKHTFSDYIQGIKKDRESSGSSRNNRWPEHEALLLTDALLSGKGQKLVSEIDQRVLERPTRRKFSDKRDEAIDATFSVSAYLNGDLHTDGVSPDALYWAVRFGYLHPTRLRFAKTNGDACGQDELSAGQWSLFSTMTSLALSVQNDTLILVDEPESCLHPTWQRRYIEFILRAIDHAKGCHVILATHAPLILSSLPTTNADCVVFERGQDTEVSGYCQSAPSGWDVTSILENVFSISSARGPELTDLLNEALGLVAHGLDSNIGKLRVIVKQLESFMSVLPEDDLVRDVIGTVKNLSIKEKMK